MIRVSLENLSLPEDAEGRYVTAFVKTESLDQAAKVAARHYGDGFKVTNIMLRESLVALNSDGEMLA